MLLCFNDRLFHLILTAVVQKVNGLIENGEYGRLFAVVHFASRQWKVTNEDLILIENHIDAACGDRIRMEKVVSCRSSYTQITLQLTGLQMQRFRDGISVFSDLSGMIRVNDLGGGVRVIIVIQMASWVLKQFHDLKAQYIRYS